MYYSTPATINSDSDSDSDVYVSVPPLSLSVYLSVSLAVLCCAVPRSIYRDVYAAYVVAPSMAR